jgi:Asp-tRNA(Asn)/Glu-tRNA(Gln) amidotransferase A subunit family amidase
VDKPSDDYLLQIDKGVKGWRIAIAAGTYIQEANADVLAAVDEAGRIFRDLGADVIRVDMDNLRELALSNGQMVAADAAALHRERIKGTRIGSAKTSANAWKLAEDFHLLNTASPGESNLKGSAGWKISSRSTICSFCRPRLSQRH